MDSVERTHSKRQSFARHLAIRRMGTAHHVLGSIQIRAADHVTWCQPKVRVRVSLAANIFATVEGFAI